jgi:hypothetical protein
MKSKGKGTDYNTLNSVQNKSQKQESKNVTTSSRGSSILDEIEANIANRWGLGNTIE